MPLTFFDRPCRHRGRTDFRWQQCSDDDLATSTAKPAPAATHLLDRAPSRCGRAPRSGRVPAMASPEFDPGPPPALASLFADCPPPTAFQEHFWFVWGPVFYRGRLDGSARLLGSVTRPDEFTIASASPKPAP